MRSRAYQLVACLVFALWSTDRAFAYQYTSTIAYATSSATLTGSSQTWKDPWNWNYIEDCVSWVSDEFGTYCYVYFVQTSYAAVDGKIYRLSLGSPVHSEFRSDYSFAATSFVQTFPAGDYWTAQGQHYADNHYVYFVCPYSFCYPTGGGVYSVHLGTTLDDESVCGTPHVDALVREYADLAYLNQLRPGCSDFSSGGGTTHFSWSVLNGGFADGNPHPPWGMVSAALKVGLEGTYSNYFNPTDIRVNSGYRCPHGNASSSVGGVPNSPHTHGTAADLWTWSLGPTWSQSQFDVMRNAALAAGAVSSLPYNFYSDHHLHVEF